MGEIFEHGDGVYGENGVDGMGWMGPRIIMRGTERKGNREERSEASKARPGGSKQAGRGGAKRGQAERGLYFSQYFW